MMGDKRLKKIFNKICEKFLDNYEYIARDGKPDHDFIYFEKIRNESCYICK